MENAVQLITEIFQGYTELSFAGSSVFLRHINIKDQSVLDSLIKKKTAEFLKRGIPSEKDRLKDLAAQNLWTDKEELDISEKEYELKNLYQTKKKILIPSQKKGVQDLIDNVEKEIAELKTKRLELIGQTAEYFAARKTNEEFLRHLLYKDDGLSQLSFSEQEFGELGREQVSELFSAYQVTMGQFLDDEIQKAVLQDFFSVYLPFCEKPWDFYGRPIINLSVFQQKVLVYGRLFLNIFQNTDKIPDDIRKDPKALLDFADSSKNKEKLNKGKKGEGSTSFVVGTRQDAEFLAEDGAQVGDLAEELKNSGGFLSRADLLKKIGISV